MKILYITVWKPRKGGIVTHVENLVKRSKNESLILTYNDRSQRDTPGVIRAPYINLPILRGASFAVTSFFKALGIDFDIIHAHYAVPQGFAGVLIKKAKRKPLVLTVHGSDLTVLGGSRFTRPILKWVFNNSDRIIAVSRYMEGLITGLGVEKEKVRVIYNGVEPENPAKGDEKRMVFIGALVRQKGADIAITAFKELKEKHGDSKLLIVGDGPERKRLERLSRELGLTDIEFRGYVEDINGVFTAKSILVLPSREEGFGMVLLEAMARGVPVIAAKTGGIVEIVADGENGLLFTKEDPGSLADATARIFEDGLLKERLIKGGFETVEKFTWEKTEKETTKVYEELAG